MEHSNNISSTSPESTELLHYPTAQELEELETETDAEQAGIFETIGETDAETNKES